MNPTTSPHRAAQSGSETPAKRTRPTPGSRTPGGLEQRLVLRARAMGFAPGDRLVVGFSGGRDSLALAAAMRRLQAVLGIEPLLVHVDHKLRESSAADAQAAADLAAALGLEPRIVAVPALPMAAHPGVGVEEAARRERYRLLFGEARVRGARAVVTAHHQGDQAETVLLHLLRGGGVHGATAMSERSPSPVPASAACLPGNDLSQEAQTAQGEVAEPWLWRPFLSETRTEINAYVERLGLTPVEDPSNDDIDLRRNVLRHEVLPLLERHLPGASSALARYAALAAEDDRVLEALAQQAARDAVDPGGLLMASRLRELPVALQRRVVRRWLWQATASASFTAERTEAIVALARAARGGAIIEIGEGWTVRRERGMLRVQRLAGDVPERVHD